MTALTQRRRVLIVDGHAESRVVHTTFLRHHGMVARGVAVRTRHYACCVPFARKSSTGLVLTGRHFDGLAFISAVRQRHDIRAPVVVVVSGFTQQADLRRARSVGADWFLVAPCLPERLLLEVRRAFYTRHLAEVTH